MKYESQVAHKRLPRVAFGLILIGIFALIVLMEYAVHLPTTLTTFYFSLVLFILAIFCPMLGLLILMIVKPTKDRFMLDEKAASELSPDELRQLNEDIARSNNY
jgi:Mg2+/Co2+ transporter CorB